MKAEVATGIEELKRQFATASLTVREDGQGGAYVTMDSIMLGPRYQPSDTWVGFHIPPQYPYAGIYPLFIGGNVVRADGVPFGEPLRGGQTFEGRSAIQVSRRNGAAQDGLQKAPAKIL
jgi:hypothetical protein